LKGYFRRRGCTCKKKRCTCGAKWSFTVDIGINPATGERKQKTVSGFDTKAEAEEVCAALILEIKSGTYIQETNQLFKDFAQEWLKIYQNTNSVKISTVRVRQHEINKLLPFFAHLKIRDITKKKYQEALNALRDREGLADNTISGVHATGRMIFRKALEYDLIKKDPTEFARVSRAPKTVEEIETEIEIPKYMEKKELAQFLDTAKTKGLDQDHITFVTLAYTGMRTGELCALKWRDIDTDTGTISITKTYYNPRNNIIDFKLLPPKTKRSKRVIEVDKFVLGELEKHKAMQNKIKMRKRDIYFDDGDFVLINTEKHPGYPLYIKKIENRMRRLLKLSGLDTNLTPHSLRHTHTSLLAEAGVDLPQIMDRLGHADDETTKLVYLHVTKTMRSEAAKKFSDLMKNL